MTAVFAWLSSNPIVRNIIIVLALVLSVILALFGFKKSAEKTGRLVEREANRVAADKAVKKMEKVEKLDRAGASKRLRDGTF